MKEVVSECNQEFGNKLETIQNQNPHDEYILEVYISREKNNLVIIIRDNGSGMSSDLVNRINNGQTIKTEGKNHIGMDNAIMRLNMYCEGQAKVMVTSEINKGTEVKLILPILIWNE